MTDENDKTQPPVWTNLHSDRSWFGPGADPRDLADAERAARHWKAEYDKLAASPPPAVSVKPVAWRWVWKTTGSDLEQRFADPDLYEWGYRHDFPVPTGERAEKMEIELLYTAPPAADKAALEEENERLRAELEQTSDLLQISRTHGKIDREALAECEGRADALQARLQVVEAALREVADKEYVIHDHEDDRTKIPVRIGAIRRARAVLDQKGGEK